MFSGRWDLYRTEACRTQICLTPRDFVMKACCVCAPGNFNELRAPKRAKHLRLFQDIAGFKTFREWCHCSTMVLDSCGSFSLWIDIAMDAMDNDHISIYFNIFNRWFPGRCPSHQVETLVGNIFPRPFEEMRHDVVLTWRRPVGRCFTIGKADLWLWGQNRDTLINWSSKFEGNLWAKPKTTRNHRKCGLHPTSMAIFVRTFGPRKISTKSTLSASSRGAEF